MGVSLRASLIAGAAVLAAAAVTPAMAEDGQVHVVNVVLPSGGIEQIRYVGDVAPRVVLVPAPAMMATPVMEADPFAALERVSALINQQAAAVFRQMQAFTDAPVVMPPGAGGYSFSSTISGSGVCMRSVRITYRGGDAAPQMVSSTSGDGDCDHSAQPPSEVNTPAPAIHPAPNTIEVRATTPTLDARSTSQVAWNR